MPSTLRALRISPLLLLAGGIASAGGPAAGPRPAPAQYFTGQYGLTFTVPTGATYCPLPHDWAGSDHGTTIFLEPPRTCGGAGYPSSSRGYAPEGVARIELFYRYWMGDEDEREIGRPPCRQVAAIRFLGAARPVCETREDGLIVRTVSARYSVEAGGVADLTLVTRAARLDADQRAFAAAAASMRTCTATFGVRGKRFTVGTGRPCPRKARWF